MADQENTGKDPGSEPQAPRAKGVMGKIVPVLAPILAVVVCTGAGFGISRLFGTRSPSRAASAGQTSEAAGQQEPTAESSNSEGWFYDLEPVVANLNEPGVTRYVRVSLTLEIGNGMAEKDGTPFLDQKKPLMKHWLTLYLSNATIDTIRGEKNLRQVQTQITDVLNQGLFPNGKPKVVRVLFKELAIQ